MSSKILISQMAECRHIDPVFGKALPILGHADLLEPVQNLLHRHTWKGSILGNLTEKRLKTNDGNLSRRNACWRAMRHASELLSVLA